MAFASPYVILIICYTYFSLVLFYFIFTNVHLPGNLFQWFAFLFYFNINL